MSKWAGPPAHAGSSAHFYVFETSLAINEFRQGRQRLTASAFAPYRAGVVPKVSRNAAMNPLLVR